MAELKYLHADGILDPGSCVSVDGDAPGRLHLSHWPGNSTPDEFKHDLSTGSCLLLAYSEHRLETLAGITTVTNNHWDTDGACSVFAMIEPGLALAQAPHLLSAAASGDFGLFTTPEGVKIDLTLTALTKRDDSPVASSKFADNTQRRQAQYEHAIELLPRLLANPNLHADWFAQEFWIMQQDLRALREDEVEIERFDALDFAVVTTDRALHETSVNTFTGADRVLTVQRSNDGQRQYDFRLTTLSWFELVTRKHPPRLDWRDLIDALNKEANEGNGTWQGDDITTPTPHLAFVDENGVPATNHARPDLIKRTIAGFLTRRPDLEAGI